MSVNIHISDLFFNHQNEGYNEIMQAFALAATKKNSKFPTGEEINDALISDAQNFIDMIRPVIASEELIPTVQDLVDNFMERL